MIPSLTYVVHSVTVDPIVVDATVGNRKVRATVPGLTVEMLSYEDGIEHGHTFRWLPDSEQVLLETIAALGYEADLDHPANATFKPESKQVPRQLKRAGEAKKVSINFTIS